MANDVTKNPWLIDTPGAGVVSSEKLRIETIKWSGTTIVATDQLVVQDKNGRQIWAAVSDAAGEGDEFRLGPLFNSEGLVVPTMTHGLLSVFLR